MITNRVQTVLHTAARGDVDHNNAWHAVWMQPDSTYHNQLLTTHMGTVRVSKTKHTMEISSKSFFSRNLEFGYGVWGTTDLGTGGGCTSILSQQKPLSVGVRITVSSRGTPALLSPPNTTPPPLYEHAEWEWRASGATPSTGICKWHPVVMYESCARYVLAPYLYSWNLLNDSFKIYLTYLICGGLYAYGPCVMWY